MELNSLKDAFDRVTEKRNMSCLKIEQVIDQVVQVIEKAVEMAQSTTLDCKFVLAELKKMLQEIGPAASQIDSTMKELSIALSKYTKALEKSFIPDISIAYRNVEFDSSTLNQIIASHCYQQGMFDVGDCFINEAGDAEAVAAMRSIFQEMHQIFDAMKSRNLEPSLKWAAANSEKLKENGSDLLLRLHHLQFVEIVQNRSADEAHMYARANFPSSAGNDMDETHKLMACLLYSNRLHESPYAHLLSPSNWDAVTKEITSQFCNPLWQSSESPLSVTIVAGVQGLPQLLKFLTVMPEKIQEWQSMKQLPVPVELDKEFQFHSVFVCPVSMEQSTYDNPPMLMPCSHVLSKESITILSLNGSISFRCPFCLSLVNSVQCRQLSL